MVQKVSNKQKVLSFYQAKRDNHGRGRKNGLQVIELAQKFHWRKSQASSALATAKSEGWNLSPPLLIDCDTVRYRVGDKIRTKHVHFIPANDEEMRDCIEKHHVRLIGMAKAQKTRLDIGVKMFPNVIYASVMMISKKLKLIIPAPKKSKKK